MARRVQRNWSPSSSGGTAVATRGMSTWNRPHTIPYTVVGSQHSRRQREVIEHDSQVSRSKDVKTFQRATLTAIIVLMASSTSWAQGMNVALLDVGYIFKGHPGFKRQMDAMRAEVKSFEAGLQQQQQQIEAASKQLASYKPGTPAYKQLEEKTTKQLADLKVQMQLKRKDIMVNEAKIYMTTYRQVAATVAVFANARNIDLVLRYDREANPSSELVDPRETLKIINRPVIFEKQLDISDSILRQLTDTARK